MAGLSSTSPPGQTESAYYDDAGNLKIFGSHTLTYDGENRPVQATGNGTVTYTYDGEGRRVRKVDAAGVTTVYAYNAFGDLASEHTSAARRAPRPPTT